MSDAHDPPLREGHRGDARRGLDWLIISGPVSEDFALRIAALCFLGPPMDHGDGPSSYRRRPEIARRTRRRTLVIQRHGEGEDAPAGGTAAVRISRPIPADSGVTPRNGKNCTLRAAVSEEMTH
jgi:hypothetical protein